MYKIMESNVHYRWRAGDTDFEKDTFSPNSVWVTVARPCESSAWCGYIPIPIILKKAAKIWTKYSNDKKYGT